MLYIFYCIHTYILLDRSLDHVAVIISSIVAVILVMLIAFLLGYCTYKMLIRRYVKLKCNYVLDIISYQVHIFLNTLVLNGNDW